MSGAGNIKMDASDDETMVEYKTAGKGFSLKSADLHKTYKQATREGKECVWVIIFENGVRLTGIVTKE